MLERRSPFDDYVGTNSPSFVGETGVVITPRVMQSLVHVQAFASDMGAVANALDSLANRKALLESGGSGEVRTKEGAITQAFNIGPGRLLVESPSPGLEEQIRSRVDETSGAVSDLTHARVCYRIDGPKTRFVLSKAVNIDLELAVTPIGQAFTTGIHHVSVHVVRLSETAFELYVLTTFAESILEWLIDASLEVGYAIDEMET